MVKRNGLEIDVRLARLVSMLPQGGHSLSGNSSMLCADSNAN
jgi:hypothetical protein